MFLLRPEIPIFVRTGTRAKRLAQTIVNLAGCMAAFMLAIWIIDPLVSAVAENRPLYSIQPDAAG